MRKQRTSFWMYSEWSTHKAQTSPACTQPIQEVVGHRLEIRDGMVWRRGNGKAYSGVPAKVLLGEMSRWDDILPKRSKDELKPLGACHEG